jgi:hypothetical protein
LGFNADQLLQLLSYGLIPISVLFIDILLSMAYSKSG